MRQPISRRDFVRISGTGAVVTAWAQTEKPPGINLIPANTVGRINGIAESFRKQFDVPGLAIAIAKQGKLTYEGSFGEADKQRHTPVTPQTRFRIASVSKPFTSVTIFSLIEEGRLRLEDRVFGRNSVFGNQYGGPSFRKFVEEIQIEHLLTHTCGGWQNDARDPMFLYPKWDHTELIRWTIANEPLSYLPGSHYAYSNFGYCLLGRVIEKLTGQPYAQYVRTKILAPCGIWNMAIGGNTEAQREPDEAVYYGQNHDKPYDMNVRRMDSHGGWIATATDLVKFAIRVDGFHDVPSLLKPETIRVMTTGTVANPGYAKGWAVNTVPNWWHAGSLPGTASLLVRTAKDFCWSAIANTRKDNPDISSGMDKMMWQLVSSVPGWQP